MLIGRLLGLYLQTLWQSHRGLTVRALILAVAYSASGGLGLLLIVPLLGLIGVGAPASLPLGLHQAMQAIHWQPDLTSILLIFLVVTTATAWLQRTETLASNELYLQFPLRLQRDLYTAIGSCRWTHFVTLRNSQLLQACTSEIDRVRSSISSLCSLLLQCMVLLAHTLVALVIAPRLTAFCGALGLISVIFVRSRIQRAYRLGQEMSEDVADVYHTISEHLQGFHVARCYGAQQRHIEAFGRHNLLSPGSQPFRAKTERLSDFPFRPP